MSIPTSFRVSLLTILAAFSAGTICNLASATESWPQFRGPNCAGVAENAKPPIAIGTNQGVLWNADVPWSPSSPCVWGDFIFLTTFSEGDLQTRGYSRGNGNLLWTKAIKPPQLEMYHSTESSPATATPATDGKHVVSYFGSFGLICHDFKGKELWRHPLPVALSGGGFGSGTSPALVRNFVILNRDQDQNSSLLVVDVATGKTVWETPRSDATGCFGTPIFWKNGKADEIVMPGTVQLKGYDLKTGQERWVVDGMVGFACTTPVTGDGLLFFGGWSPGQSDSPWPSWEVYLEQHDKNHDGEITFDEFEPASREFIRGLDRDHDGKITKKDWDMIKERAVRAKNVLVAVKPGGHGDITQTHVAWSATRGLPYVPSPLFYQDRLYIIKDGGMISCFDARTGTPFYSQERLEAADKYYSSPVAADGRIYVASLSGKLTVLKAGGDRPETLHQANFGERIFATPAPVGRNLYLRTVSKLYAF